MAYRNLPIVIERRKWDLIPFGPHEYKLIFWWRLTSSEVRYVASSPIVAPLDLLGRVLEGFVPDGPVEFEVWSGKIYRLHGKLERCPLLHSAIALHAAAKQSEPSLFERLLARVYPR